jgi:hypothetical protein
MRWLAALCLLSAGCPASTLGYPLLDERFEDEAAFRSAWVIAGDVTLVTTNHPAEHGLEVRSASTLTHALAVTIYDEYSDGDWLEYSTSCGGAPEVWTEQQPDLSFHVIANIPAVWDGDPEFERIYAGLPPLPIPDWNNGGTAVTISGLTLIFDEPVGTCVLDNLRFYQPNTISGY